VQILLRSQIYQEIHQILLDAHQGVHKLQVLLGLHSSIPRFIYYRLFSPDYYFLMATMKYDIPLLNRDTRFALWQVKMRAVLAQADLDDAPDKFGNKDSKNLVR
jgi:hypothetical protein